MQAQLAPAVAEVARQAMWFGIRLEGWLTIAAVIIGPILALCGTTMERAAAGKANS